MHYKALSIAGFDGSGGAGIQADLKTFSALGCYAMTVLTALPVQNTQGVQRCYAIPVQCIAEQIAAIFTDIVPHAIKIGMLFDAAIIRCVSEGLAKFAAGIPVVLDPVMVAKSGDNLLQPDAVALLKTLLMPQVDLITPNLPEAECLLQRSISNEQDMLLAAQELLTLGAKAVLLKGGHASGVMARDLLLSRTDQQIVWLEASRIDTRNTHGTGCTLSAAIAAQLALGDDLETACRKAKHYLTQALIAAKDIGKGQGPVHHFYQYYP